MGAVGGSYWTVTNYDFSEGFTLVGLIALTGTFTPVDNWEGGKVEIDVGCLAHAAPVGGVIMPVNTFAVLAPWLVVIALVSCMTIVVVVAKKRRL